MRYIWLHIQSIIDGYTGALPLAIFLKDHFRKHPKLGSRDRKILSEMTYCWYRANKGLNGKLSFEEKIKACLFICETNVPQVLQFLPETWQHKPEYSLDQKIKLLKNEQIDFDINRLISSSPDLSTGILEKEWLISMLQQPQLFIRFRKDPTIAKVIFKENNISFSQLENSCFSLPNNTNVAKLFPAKDYVIQDVSSQSTGTYFLPKTKENWWDCCAGAGGKSLLLKDLQPSVHLTVSDKRKTILHNLEERFHLYFNEIPTAYVLDVTDETDLKSVLKQKQFDNIICDVPCTGSGTWARTPEQLFYFNEKTISEFSERQKMIANNVVQFLKPNGRLIYITCSIFKEENESVVNDIMMKNKLQLEESMLIKGIENKADSMFIAVLISI